MGVYVNRVKMIVIGTLFVFLSSVHFVDAAGGGYADTWNYVEGGDKGPAHWSQNYPHCGGSKQSPVNIFTKYAQYHNLLGTLKLNNYDYKGDNVYFAMHNRNTDIAFVAKTKDGKPVPQEVVFQGTTYRFYQFHFHWGAHNYRGSEHVLDWQRFAGEMHMIHYNTKYNNVTEAAPHADGLLVWGHFLKVSSDDEVFNRPFSALLGHFGNTTVCCNDTDIRSFSLKDLLPQDYGQFYHYSGSLTTPPCYESVKWIVDRSPILVNEEQMEIFRSLKDNADGVAKQLVDHFRPVQPLHDREVQRNFDDKKESSANSINKSTIMFVSSVLAALLLTLR